MGGFTGGIGGFWCTGIGSMMMPDPGGFWVTGIGFVTDPGLVWVTGIGLMPDPGLVWVTGIGLMPDPRLVWPPPLLEPTIVPVRGPCTVPNPVDCVEVST